MSSAPSLADGTGFEPFDQLATMVALVSPDGQCLQANSAMENVVGLSRRALRRGNVLDWLTEPTQLHDTLQLVSRNQVSTSRFDAQMRRVGAVNAELPVHVIVNQTERPDRVLVEMIEIEQQIRLDREERTHGLAQAGYDSMGLDAVGEMVGEWLGRSETANADLLRHVRDYNAVLGLTPLFGTELGLPVPFIVWLLSAIQLGSFVCQWPLGRLSDRVDRRLVIAGCVLALAGLSVVAGLAGERQAWLLPAYFLMGGTALTFYAVAVAHAADFAEPDQMVGVSSSLLLAWAVGSALGPSIAAPFIDLLGPSGLFLYSFVTALGLAGFVLWRMTRRAAPPKAAKEGFVDHPAATPRLAQIDPRMPERPAT